jgi:hypothetical protein
MDGTWRQWAIGEETGFELKLEPVFYGSVLPIWSGGKQFWLARLNERELGSFPTLEQAKAQVDWSIWSNMRRKRPGYLKLLERRRRAQDRLK